MAAKKRKDTSFTPAELAQWIATSRKIATWWNSRGTITSAMLSATLGGLVDAVDDELTKRAAS